MKTKLNLTIVALLLAVSNLSAATHYVSLGSTSPTLPYTNWVSAATNIQDAVNAAAAGDTVLVTNGVYPGGLNVTNPLALRSVNGPLVTVINGGGRCATLTNGASLTGFTVTKGWAMSSGGGGVWCASTNAFLTNCVISSNSCTGHWFVDQKQGIYICIPGIGGGVYGGTLYNCTLTGNSANLGGGVFGGTLYNCTLSGNRVTNSYSGGLGIQHVYYGRGGGASGSTLYNCIVCSNTATYYGANYYDSALNYCCTTPMPIDGIGNITNAPLFVDYAGGNLRLQSNSPCINAGNNAYVTAATDLDGHPRIVSGTVDLGAYEYQGTGSVISYAWLQQNGLTTDGSADYTDPDHDGMNNWQEWICDTCPTNAASCLHLTIISNTPPVAVTFSSSAARLYTLLCCTNLTPGSVWTPVPGQSDMPGSGDVLTLTDANPPATVFYRVSVRFP
ncbi:MAG: choice-of-anchor Q domain-containing protein [Verrucomicrobiota bacterium]